MDWSWLRPKRTLSAEQEARLVEAIRRAEEGHRGEILVHVEQRCREVDALTRAARLFDEMGARKTAEDTAVLLYVAVADRKAAVYAGRGVHRAALPGFWQEVVDEVAAGYRKGDALAGLEAAIARIGGVLRTAAPGVDAQGNELPDRVSQG